MPAPPSADSSRAADCMSCPCASVLTPWVNQGPHSPLPGQDQDNNTPSPVTMMTRTMINCSLTQHTPGTTPVWISLYHVLIAPKAGTLTPPVAAPLASLLWSSTGTQQQHVPTSLRNTGERRITGGMIWSWCPRARQSLAPGLSLCNGHYPGSTPFTDPIYAASPSGGEPRGMEARGDGRRRLW